ncbi:OLC1v1001341C1 [Oldenlandia corymbosa var. corymbosa]|uniref:OLC1v1001341C1 n=1 Tax=Oldenlandia corymbosa var. corymbosa TaxID=529605 RepID=A0AAV1D4Z0_OLDCO|nr:OLC1v1001341C1 [Oldenlandia corymbosa var. corymbosa]
MARFAISLLALLVLASYASATTLEEVCKGTTNATYCVKLLQPTVMPDTDFNSTLWHKMVISRAVTRAMMAKDFMARLPNVPKENTAALSACAHKLRQSIKLLREAAAEYGVGPANVTGTLDRVSAFQNACSGLLKDVGAAMEQVRVHANEAAAATYIAKDLI